MSEVQQVIVTRKGTGMVAGIIASVLAILGIFTIGTLFVPIAAIVMIIGTITAIKNKNVGGIGANLLAGILTLVGLATSPVLLELTGLINITGI